MGGQGFAFIFRPGIGVANVVQNRWVRASYFVLEAKSKVWPQAPRGPKVPTTPVGARAHVVQHQHVTILATRESEALT